MTDIVERLRAELDDAKEIGHRLVIEAVAKIAEIERLTTLHEAAAARAELAQIEIERLRQDNAEMRELLNTLAGRALEPKP